MLAVSSKWFPCCFPRFLGFRVRYSRYKSAAERDHQQYGCYMTFLWLTKLTRDISWDRIMLFLYWNFIRYIIMWGRQTLFSRMTSWCISRPKLEYLCGWKQKSQIACCLWSHKNFKPGNVRYSVYEVLGSGGHHFATTSLWSQSIGEGNSTEVKSWFLSSRVLYNIYP